MLSGIELPSHVIRAIMGDKLPSLTVGIEKRGDNSASEFYRDSANNDGSILKRVQAVKRKTNSARAAGSGRSLYYDSNLDVDTIVSEREIPAWIVGLKSKKRDVATDEEESARASAVGHRRSKFLQRLMDEGIKVS